MFAGSYSFQKQKEGASVQVHVRDNNVDQALKALKKKMQREGIFREMKLRNYYEKPSEKEHARRLRLSAAPASLRARRRKGKASPFQAAWPLDKSHTPCPQPWDGIGGLPDCGRILGPML